ncbi:MAG: TonB-dependent receptor [Myxococcota bacterium]|nr:TonB-dependent receptor [Myxococcota bacterium]
MRWRVGCGLAVATCVWGVALLGAEHARAQEQPALTPPELETYAEATAPDVPIEAPVEVVLTLTISPEGEVTEAEVFSSGGEAFDAAALEAGRRLVFRPATRDGEAIPARIRFRYTFEPPPPPPPAPEPTTGTLEGQVVGPDGTPVEGARLFVDASAGDVSRQATTDAEGRFSLEELPAGDYLVAVESAEHAAFDETETIAAGEALEVSYRLSRSAAEEEEEPELGVTAVIERPRREATRRTIPREALTSIPGTRGDALRVVELLPGVARPPFLAGLLIIRGAAPQDSEVFLNGSSVPLLYHFGGLTSFYNSRLLERIDFYPGNFGVRYGRRIGGILEVEPRDPASDRVHGVLDINLIDSSLLIETPIGDNAGIAIAARRSYVDFFFSEVVPDDVFDVLAAPVYYDYQLIFSWKPTSQDRLRALVYGSSDEFRTIFNGDEFARPFGLELSTQFHRGQLEWRHVYDDVFQQDVMISAGWTGLVIQAGQAFGFDADFVPVTARTEWQLTLAEEVKLRWGFDWQYTPSSLAIRTQGTPTQSEGQPQSANPNAPRAEDTFSADAYRPAVYLESTLQPFEPLTLVLGVRLDYYREISDWSFDPRMTFRLAVDPQWTIKGGVGVFSQPPEFQETAPGLGNPDLDPITSLHNSLGVEFELDEVWRFELDTYYKHIFDRVVGTEDGRAPFFTNEGVGRIYGAELGVRAQPTPGYPVYGFASYTLSRSERQDRDGEWRPFDFDQTHIFTLALVWRIGDGWEAGGTFRLVSGNPFTPVTGSIYDVAADTYRPLYGAVNSERNPFFHRLDLRIEKVFNIENVMRLAIYLDVQNVYNQQNREATTYSFDYAESAEVPGLPILPSLGIRGEL